MTQPELVDCPVDRLPGESVVVLYFEDQKPLDGPAALLDWRLDGQLTKMLLDGSIRGRAGEHVMLQGNGKFEAEWALFVGGGKWHGLSEGTHASLVRHMLNVACKAGFSNVSLAFSSHEEVNADCVAQHVSRALETVDRDVESCVFTCDASLAVSSSSN